MRRLFLTGTPILNRSVEFWAIVSALTPEDAHGSGDARHPDDALEPDDGEDAT